MYCEVAIDTVGKEKQKGKTNISEEAIEELGGTKLHVLLREESRSHFYACLMVTLYSKIDFI